MNQTISIKQNPQNIITEIVRDYPGRFYLDETELRRLISDIESLLKEQDRTPDFKFWVGLQNGIVYETDSLNTVLAEENAQSLTIRFLVIFAELDSRLILNGQDVPGRRIIVHFSRGTIQRSIDVIRLGNDWFNLNFEGMNYRMTDNTRGATLKSITAVEERLRKLRRWHSVLPKFPINQRSFIYQLLTILFPAIPLYSLLALVDIRDGWGYSNFTNTTAFLSGALLGTAVVVACIFLANFLLLLINWIIPPTVIAIGDEIVQSKKKQSLREYIFWSVIVAAFVGIVVNIISR